MNRLICTLFNNPSMVQLNKNKDAIKEMFADLSIPNEGSGKENKIFLHNGKIIDGEQDMHPDNYKLVEKIYQALRLKFILIYFNSDDLKVSYKKNKGYINELTTNVSSEELQDIENARKLFRKYGLYFLLLIIFCVILIYKYVL